MPLQEPIATEPHEALSISIKDREPGAYIARLEKRGDLSVLVFERDPLYDPVEWPNV